MISTVGRRLLVMVMVDSGQDAVAAGRCTAPSPSPSPSSTSPSSFFLRSISMDAGFGGKLSAESTCHWFSRERSITCDFWRQGLPRVHYCVTGLVGCCLLLTEYGIEKRVEG